MVPQRHHTTTAPANRSLEKHLIQFGVAAGQPERSGRGSCLASRNWIDAGLELVVLTWIIVLHGVLLDCLSAFRRKSPCGPRMLPANPRRCQPPMSR